MKNNRKKIILFFSFYSLSQLCLLVLYYCGVNSYIMGTYTIATFIVLSTAFVKVFTQTEINK
ncbi:MULTISPECIES: hypothetical protein [unclassified Psychrobacillus]|uniref:hypothetical protein n=1 Tax=unclassified Psychrobacillus TaxID=2636677 RepID=UPI0030F87783